MVFSNGRLTCQALGRQTLVVVSLGLLATATGAAVSAPPITNVGVAAIPEVDYFLPLNGGGLAFVASETDQSADLNGDGDFDDGVIFVRDKRGRVENLRMVGQPVRALDGGGFAFVVTEAGNGRDYNGDGDVADVFTFVHEPDGRIVNTGLGPYLVTALDGGGLAMEVSERILACDAPPLPCEVVDEEDLNGDGDAGDRVVFVREADGRVVNTRIALIIGVTALVGGDFIAPVPERTFDLCDFTGCQVIKEIDLNGDGDADDVVFFMYRRGGGVTNMRITGLSSVGLDDGGFAFTKVELGDGIDYSGDGDLEDVVLCLWQPSKDVIVTPIALSVELGILPLRDGGLFFTVDETEQQRDLNGDGDSDDVNVAFIRSKSGEVLNTRLVVNPFYPVVALDGGAVSMPIWESEHGADLNGDGDLLDNVTHVCDAKGLSDNTRLAQSYSNEAVTALVGGGLALLVDEDAQGQDLNGDGDVSDSNVLFIRQPDRTLVNSRLAGPNEPDASPVALGGGGVALLVDELRQRHDYNGDGFANDWVVFVLDKKGTAFNTALADDYHFNLVALDGGGLSFTVREAAQPRDLNNDGDLDDLVVHVIGPF